MRQVKKEIERIISEQKEQAKPEMNQSAFNRLSPMSQLRFLLKAFGLSTINNLSKSKALSGRYKLTFFTEDVLGEHYFSESGGKPLSQNLYNELVEYIGIISFYGENSGLKPLAAAGLLSEETLALFAVNPQVFNNIEQHFYGAMSDEEQSMDENVILGKLKHFIEDFVAQEKKQTSALNQDKFDRLNAQSQLPLLLQAGGLPVISNLSKCKHLYANDNLSYLTEILGKHYFSPSGRHNPLSQNLFDKLVECVDFIKSTDGQFLGLETLAASGLLNEETLELVVTNPNALQMLADLHLDDEIDEQVDDNENTVEAFAEVVAPESASNAFKEKMRNIVPGSDDESLQTPHRKI